MRGLAEKPFGSPEWCLSPSNRSSFEAALRQAAGLIVSRFRPEAALFLASASYKGFLCRSLSGILKPSLRAAAVAESPDEAARALGSAHFDLVIEGLDGLSGKSGLGLLFRLIRGSGAKVVSLQHPFGLDAESGLRDDICLASDLCIGFFGLTPGLFLNDGRDLAKETAEAGEGFGAAGSHVFLLEDSDFRLLIPTRLSHSNKGTYGRAAIVGGSVEYTGAPYLAYQALSALRVGCGYSLLCVPSSLRLSYALIAPQVTIVGIGDRGGRIVYDEEFLRMLTGAASAAVGMGLGVSEEVYRSVSYLLSNDRRPLALDADALNSLARYGAGILISHIGPVILTPHVVEFARLLGKTPAEVSSGGLTLAASFAARYGVITVLKSNSTIIADGRDAYICAKGNPGLAKGGSGDMLSGILAGLLATGLAPLKSALLAPYLLGQASEIAALRLPEAAILAEDIIAALPEAWKRLGLSLK